MKDKKGKIKKKKEYRFDVFTVEMLERIAYDEDKTRPEVIGSAVKFLFLKKYEQKDLEKLRKKHRPHN